MTRVLHLMAGGDTGGAETYFQETVCALSAAGLEQQAVTRHHPARKAALAAAGVPTVTSAFGGWLDFSTRQAVKRVISTFNPHIVQAWMGRAATFLPADGPVNVGWFGGYYNLKRYRRADYFVGCTHDIARHLAAQGAPAGQVRTIHTFADLDDGPALNRAEFSTPDGVPLLLFLGRLHVKKGVDIALKALAELPDCWLWIAGEGPLRRELEALAAQLGVAERTRFLGWRTDRGALLRTADMLLVPSRYEPFGTIMVEAWATGTPLIAAAAAGPSAYVETEKNGLLVPIDDAPALALAVRRVIGNPALAAELAAGGTATYEAQFTRERIVRDWLEFYSSITSPSGRGRPAQPDG
jgi:glycosyltransferase involved in cell wall biosynthesis